MKQVVLAMLATIVLLYGCSTAHFMKAGSTAYPPYDGEVRVVDVPLEGVDYELIGIVSVGRPWDTRYDDLVKLMQEVAAENGADAIILCRDKTCLKISDQDSSLAAPAIRMRPRAENKAAAPPPVPAPAPVPTPVPTPAEEGKAILEKGRVTLNIQFDTNMAVVKDQYYGELAGLADVMRRYPDLKVMIEGHTDSVGDDAHNMELSQRRADSVKNFLTARFGIDASRLDARGYGETRPVADNSTDEGRQWNRRVEAAVEYEKTVK